VGSRIYFAAGFDVPCNQVAHFSRSMLKLAPGAKLKVENGEERPLRMADIDSILRLGRGADGRWRGLASLYLDGRPLGPWTYHGTRADDRNDIVAHEDRRELRGSKLLAAWTGHWDARAQNTLAMWIETGAGQGFVRHHLLDFGDCFGGLAGANALQMKRRGQVHWLDPGQVLTDFATLGAIERPWERARLGPSGTLFGFYDIESFDPETWSPSYPNPAFGRMTERDAAWMARIVAQFGEAELVAMVGAAQLEPASARELVRLLAGRRRKILERYLSRLSPLAQPKLLKRAGTTWLCAVDLAVTAQLRQAPRYAARAWRPDSGQSLAQPLIVVEPEGRVCAQLPKAPGHIVVEVVSQPSSARQAIRFHLYQLGPERYLLAGLERPDPT
jgi:hypothetical protein